MFPLSSRVMLVGSMVLAPFVNVLASSGGTPTHPDSALIKGAIQHVLKGNDRYVNGRPASSFAARIAGQHPTATVVSCSDSRVQAQALDEDPEGDLFMVREIGNQMGSGEGSIEYGVRHLHTPLLLIVGHSSCGAVKAAMGNYKELEPAIKRELDTLKVTKGNADDAQAVKRNVEQNVNEQVHVALKKFAPEVKDGRLAVIGVVYDFRNDYGQGYGRLVFVNVNGTTDPAKVKALMEGYRR